MYVARYSFIQLSEFWQRERNEIAKASKQQQDDSTAPHGMCLSLCLYGGAINPTALRQAGFVGQTGDCARQRCVNDQIYWREISTERPKPDSSVPVLQRSRPTSPTACLDAQTTLAAAAYPANPLVDLRLPLSRLYVYMYSSDTALYRQRPVIPASGQRSSPDLSTGHPRKLQTQHEKRVYLAADQPST